jgi:hypothetical protein
MSEHIHQKMVKIMKGIQPITKNRTGQGISYKFRGIDDVYEAVHELMQENGVYNAPHVLEETITERISSKGTKMYHALVKVRYIFYTEDGSSMDMVGLGEGQDTQDKAVPKAMSGAQKQVYFQAFCIPTSEKKPEAEDIQHEESVQTASKGTIQRINIMVRDLGIEREEKIQRVNKLIKRDTPITSTSQLTPQEADIVITALEKALAQVKDDKPSTDDSGASQGLSDDTQGKLRVLAGKQGIESDHEILAACTEVLKRDIEMWSDMTEAEGLAVLSQFMQMDKEAG